MAPSFITWVRCHTDSPPATCHNWDVGCYCVDIYVCACDCMCVSEIYPMHLHPHPSPLTGASSTLSDQDDSGCYGDELKVSIPCMVQTVLQLQLQDPSEEKMSTQRVGDCSLFLFT